MESIASPKPLESIKGKKVILREPDRWQWWSVAAPILMRHADLESIFMKRIDLSIFPPASPICSWHRRIAGDSGHI